ncbi:MAG: peptidylprolyl isomerase [Planctomycetota bacterium]|jgi:peptidyl-prolyl cis-trans isomerase A (cyclophilin A)
MPRACLVLLVLLAACGGDKTSFDPAAALYDPSLATLRAPARFKVRFETTKGAFVVEAHRDWAPHGVDRFYNLVRIGFFDDVAFYRVVKLPTLSMAQFGAHGDPKVSRAWGRAYIPPDAPRQPNRRGTVTFGQTALGPGTRSVQLFVNFAHNRHLDRDFAPIGEVVAGMEIAEALYSGYGESAPAGRGPVPGRLLYEGNAYLKQEEFSKLDYIKRAILVD